MTECVQWFVLDLPETLRTPLILHDMVGLKNAEIAQVVDCSLEAAKMRLYRAGACGLPKRARHWDCFVRKLSY